ncbi:MAG: glycosyltransferase involved in cell wall biosynthesis [Rickettsiales bacterium]|jgi:glycosyltransferase involved in cell wall biosynthesis
MKLSIIIPVYNEAEYIAFALESALYQRVSFDYEIIVYDDNSNDETADIVLDYQKSFPLIKYYKNEVNLGNAKTFYNALKVASGDYFQVLDGDDFFTNWHKLERQVEFLDNNHDYCAVAHECVVTRQGENIDLERLNIGGNKTHEYSYDKNKLFKFYYHTSTFMFKNIFKHNLYKVLQEDFCRGDVIRFQVIQSITNEKIKYLNFIGSVYNFRDNGIWTSLSTMEKHNLSLGFCKKRRDHLFNGAEKEVMDAEIESLAKGKISKPKDLQLISLEELMNFFHKSIGNFLNLNPRRKEYMLQNRNYFSQIDQLLEVTGRICLFKNNFKIHGREYKKDTYVFIVGGFQSDNGEVIEEVKDFIKIFKSANKKIYIFSTENVETSEELIDNYFNSTNVKFIKSQGNNFYEKLNFLIKEIHNIAPERLYPYVNQNDVVAGALIQKHLSKEIIMSLVSDQGVSLAVSNSSITRYIAKNDAHYYTLKSINKNNIIDIIPPLFDCEYLNSYIPFKNHKNLITSSFCDESRKIGSDYHYQYLDLIVSLLRKTGGKHYHFGPLSGIYEENIYKEIASFGLNKDCFIHIELVKDFGLALIEKEIDLFISPFPISRSKISIEANAAGVPILAHHSTNRLFSSKYFLSPNNLYWEDMEDFNLIIDSLDNEILHDISLKVRSFYEANNSIETYRNLLLNLESLPYKESSSKKSFIDLGIWLKEPLKSLIKKDGKKLCRYKFMLFLSQYRVFKIFISQKKISKMKNYL